ncbi:MAG: putative Ig domain-containing protein [Verrucomicrobiota bacterium]
MKPFSLAAACAAGLGFLSGPLSAAPDSGPATPQEGILTPVPGPAPRINGPAVFGARPGAPFLYAIPATGVRPITFSADGLPAGLTLDAATGQITGTVRDAATYRTMLRAANAAGTSERPFRIIIGDRIALTPPMGWNSWNCWGDSVSQAKVLSSAQALVAKGLKDHGWVYVNVDDGWQGARGGPHQAIQPNGKFPDIAGLIGRVHAMGLKFGLYSTPWVMSYGGYPGSASRNADGTYDWIESGNHNANFRIVQRHDEKAPNGKVIQSGPSVSFATNDAAQWADWGVDYLKYDWWPLDVPNVQTMSNALRGSGRDIVYSLSNTATFESADDYRRLANSWRTTGDIKDTWTSVSGIGFHQQRWAPFAGPGHWNDPDMLVVGHVGWGSPHPSHLTPNEQYTHFSLWCLLSAPLLLGCDLAALDGFTLNLLTNDEVLAIDQDALGQEATPVSQDANVAIYRKPLEDGSCAVGLFNLTDTPRDIAVTWTALHLTGPQRVRDLWRQQDLGVFPDGFNHTVYGHGVVLVRLWPAPPAAPAAAK